MLGRGSHGRVDVTGCSWRHLRRGRHLWVGQNCRVAVGGESGAPRGGPVGDTPLGQFITSPERTFGAVSRGRPPTRTLFNPRQWVVAGDRKVAAALAWAWLLVFGRARSLVTCELVDENSPARSRSCPSLSVCMAKLLFREAVSGCLGRFGMTVTEAHTVGIRSVHRLRRLRVFHSMARRPAGMWGAGWGGSSALRRE